MRIGKEAPEFDFSYWRLYLPSIALILFTKMVKNVNCYESVNFNAIKFRNVIDSYYF